MILSRAVVLVVEDNALIRLSAMDLVVTAGFEAVEAQNADEAIRILEARTDIRLVFTDVEMPGSMDGVKLVHYIRNRWPRIFLIVASGRAIIEESQLPTGSRFFTKPYNDHTIVEEMTRMLVAIDPELGEPGSISH
ncbi:response regulator [Aestuariivirga litoralis]|uniref:response regulator n=1 Tax=Aestuariivirga litoralis TaxID=2650924 RepID=UPI0018C6A2B8|nr:response regulator [Aestuariivirga litoralis]MBG1231769.1 response regulator [Aestuariivirga litoralis]